MVSMALALAQSCSGSVVICYVLLDDIIFAHKPKLLSVATQLRLSPHVALRLAINGSLLAVDMHACCSWGLLGHSEHVEYL